MPVKTIVLVHGLSASNHCWEQWVTRYTDRGYTAVAIPYPGRDKSVAELKQYPDAPILRTITLPQVLDHHVKIIADLNEKPIIMGHSFGGLLTQLLLQRDLGVAGVAIDSAPPLGVLPLQWSFFKSAWPAFNPLIPASQPWYMTFEQFQYAWTHMLPLNEQCAAYDAEIVPESRRSYRSALTRNARVDRQRQRAPLLLIAGECDHILPAALNQANYKYYAPSPSVTAFKVFPGRTHYILGQQGWEDVADYALDWATQVQTMNAPVAA